MAAVFYVVTLLLLQAPLSLACPPSNTKEECEEHQGCEWTDAQHPWEQGRECQPAAKVITTAAIAGDCTLSGSYDKLDVTCTIPSVTDISPECCSLIQTDINKDLPGEQRPSRHDKQELMQKCKSFQSYVDKHAPHGGSPSTRIKALPDGLTCTEKIRGAGETACKLHAAVGKLAVTCEIPKETTITSECCSAMQSGLDKGEKTAFEHINTPQEEQELTQKCESFRAYGKQHQPRGYAMFNPKLVIESLPGGLSCTETTSGGDMLSAYAKGTVMSAISLAAGVGNKDISDSLVAVSRVAPSSVAPICVGIAGFLAGGMLVAGAFLRYSKKHHGNQYTRLTAPEVA
jgi:hypothetical protein